MTALLIPPADLAQTARELLSEPDVMGPERVATSETLDAHLQIDASDLRRTTARFSERDGAASRLVRLGLLAAWLSGMTFDEVASVSGLKPDQLANVMHGKQTLQMSRLPRVERMLEMTRLLRKVLSDDAIADWFRSPVPALRGSSPLECLGRRQLEAVERVVQSYLDPSYA